MYENELYHHGVKGMKWGVRRYINPDGSFTDKGKKRYAKASQKIMNASLYTERQVNELPRKERKATKRYLKEYHQSYVKEAKNQYKKFGKSRGLKKIDYDQKAKAYINSKTGKKVNAEDYVRAMQYKNIFRAESKEKVAKGLSYLSLATSAAAILAASYSTISR